MCAKKVVQFRENCIGCNSCVEYAPGNFEINPRDGKADLKRSVEEDGIFIAEISEIELESCKHAAEACPTGIVRIED